MSKTIYEQFADAQLAITNTLENKEILKRLSEFGFNSRRMQEGKDLLEKALRLDEAQGEMYGSFYDSTDTFYAELEEVKDRYRRHKKIARIAYERNRSMILKLKLKGGGRTLADTLDRIASFYGALAKDPSGIAAYGVSNEEVAQTYEMAQGVEATRRQQIARKGEAQHATQQRNRALKELNSWMNDFRYAARFALRDEPQWLEAIGIRVPTEK